MRKILISSTALSVALGSFHTLPAMAQTVAADGSVIGPDGTVLCVPAEGQPCDLEAITRQLQAQAEAAQKAAEAAAAEQAAQAEAAQKAAEAAAAEQAAQAEAAQKAAEAAAAEQAAQAEAAQKAAEAAAAEQAAQAEAAQKAAEADKAAQAEAAQKAAEAAAAEQAAQEEAAKKAAEAAAAEQAAQAEAAQKAAEAAAAEQAAQAEAAQKAAEADKAAQAEAALAAARAAEAAQAAQAEAAEKAAEAAAAKSTGQGDAEAAQAAAAEAAKAAEQAAAEAARVAAELAQQPAVPVDIPVPETAAVESLTGILSAPATAPDGGTAPAAPPAATAAAVPPPADGSAPAAPAGAAAPVAVTTETVTASTTRTSDEEFKEAPTIVSEGKKSGLSDLEKVGLVALGALVVGAVLNEGKSDERKVVTNTGDRVVIEDAQGDYVIYKDDDAILRRPGVTATTETYRDGSTRTVVVREDGSQVVTIRDASGRVLRRSHYDRNGYETVLIDDLAPEAPIVVSELPRPRADRVTISASDGDAALKAELAAIEAEGLGRKFSLRQIREIPQVRALAATVEVDSITFDTGSSVIRATEARKLADLGQMMQNLLASNPRHVFLIEGHTDAVGSAASNLLLSDRRAESLALALTEYFGIAPENLVVQGYGESELKVDSAGDERANRRVVVRLITPLLQTAAN